MLKLSVSDRLERNVAHVWAHETEIHAKVQLFLDHVHIASDLKTADDKVGSCGCNVHLQDYVLRITFVFLCGVCKVTIETGAGMSSLRCYYIHGPHCRCKVHNVCAHFPAYHSMS